MRCENCGKAEAVVKITRIEPGGEPEQFCLCQPCAAEKSPYQKKIFEKQSTYEILFQKLLNQQQEGGAVAEVDESASGPEVATSTTECPSCGISFEQYRSTWMLGCPDCYDAFGEDMENDLHRFHRTRRHTTDEDSGPGVVAVLQERLRDAKSELKSALEMEDYERAAFLRDEIAEIESSLQSPAAPGTDS